MDSRAIKCRSEARCAKCSLLEIIRFRFGAFRAKFGRDPEPHEPLFFDPAAQQPQTACIEAVRQQVKTAAAAMGVEAEPVLHLMKLAREPRRTADSVSRQGAYQKRREPGTAWQRFVRDTRLQRAHGVSAAELEMLSRAAMMGEAGTSRDFLFMLEAIRKASRQ